MLLRDIADVKRLKQEDGPNLDARWQTAVNFRNFLTHRGALPRQHFLGTVEDRPSAVPGDPTTLSSYWQYTLALRPDLTEEYYVFLSKSMRTLLAALRQFVDSNL